MDREDGMYRDYQTREELKLEIARLREVLAANRQSAAIALDVERAKVARLRKAIQREANRHPSFLCDCQICLIAREEK